MSKFQRKKGTILRHTQNWGIWWVCFLRISPPAGWKFLHPWILMWCGVGVVWLVSVPRIAERGGFGGAFWNCFLWQLVTKSTFEAEKRDLSQRRINFTFIPKLYFIWFLVPCPFPPFFGQWGSIIFIIYFDRRKLLSCYKFWHWCDKY